MRTATSAQVEAISNHDRVHHWFDFKNLHQSTTLMRVIIVGMVSLNALVAVTFLSRSTVQCDPSPPSCAASTRVLSSANATSDVFGQFGLRWPKGDESPENVYDELIHPLHDKWSKRIKDRHIDGGEGNSGQLREQTVSYIGHIQDMVRYKVQQGGVGANDVFVCEVGFNMGHSALTFMFGAEGISEDIKVNYIGFSWPHNNHQMIAKEMKDAFGLSQRLSIVWGDSTESLPYYISVAEKDRILLLNKCDIVVVDGGHKFEVAIQDLENMKHLANKEHHVLLVDDLACNGAWCHGPVKAWTSMQENSNIIEKECLSLMKGSRGFCSGTYNF